MDSSSSSSSASSSDTIVYAQIIKSEKKGKDMIYDGGYVYYNDKRIEKKHYWACIESRSQLKCKARMTSELIRARREDRPPKHLIIRSIGQVTRHKHEPSPFKKLPKGALALMKARAGSSKDRPANMIQKAVGKLPIDAAIDLPTDKKPPIAKTQPSDSAIMWRARTLFEMLSKTLLVLMQQVHSSGQPKQPKQQQQQQQQLSNESWQVATLGYLIGICCARIVSCDGRIRMRDWRVSNREREQRTEATIDNWVGWASKK